MAEPSPKRQKPTSPLKAAPDGSLASPPTSPSKAKLAPVHGPTTLPSYEEAVTDPHQPNLNGLYTHPAAATPGALVQQRDRNPSVDSTASAASSSQHVELSAKEQITSLFQKSASEELKVADETEFRWEIPSWTELLHQNVNPRHLSPSFKCGGHEWQILLFPAGNQGDHTSVAAFLQLNWEDRPKSQHLCTDFVLAIVNPENDKIYHAQYSFKRYGDSEMDWGFNQFVKIKDLANSARPLIVNDKTLFVAHVRVIHDELGVLWHSFRDYDSKSVTGFVGLRNQGATCYMNSILQSLYCTPYFRKAVYQIPQPVPEATEGGNETPQTSASGGGGARSASSQSVTVSLQRLFYFLQTSNDAVETNELTKSFGWNTVDAFAQHDVQEFLRVLTDNIEEKMKGTPADGMIQRLFVGKMKSYIKCVHVDYESSRTEDYYDIQLNVKGMKTVTDSFKDYIQEETLEGDNKYMAEGFGLQDAKKGVVFTKFPSVMHLQLKRFEYDFMHDQMVKINDRYEFPLVLDMDDFLAERTPNTPVQRYHLHGVLVHSGTIEGGHYCAFIRPTRDNKWFKFDDDKVVPASLKEVMEDNFGGGIPPASTDSTQPNTPFRGTALRPRGAHYKRQTNAYMLVYIRESDYDEVLCNVTEEDVPAAIREQLERERKEREDREREIREREYMLTVRIIDDVTIRSHSDVDLWTFTPTPQHAAEWCKRYNKNETKWHNVHQDYAAHLGKKPEELRFWLLTNRENKTVRVDLEDMLTDAHADLTLAKVKAQPSIAAANPYELRVYCEVAAEPWSNMSMFPPLPMPGHVSPTAMIHIKVFDPREQRLWIAGHLHVDLASPIRSALPAICKLIGVPEGTPLSLHEEVHRDMICDVNLDATWGAAECQDGDIFTVQITDPQHTVDPADLPVGSPTTVPEFYLFLMHKADVLFKPKNRDVEPNAELAMALSRKLPYDHVAQRVARALSVEDPFKLRFYSTFMNEVPRGVVPRKPNVTLSDLLGANMAHFSRTLVDAAGNPQHPPPVTVLYELSDISYVEMEANRSQTMVVLLAGKEETVTVLVPKTATASALLDAAAEKLNLSAEDRAHLVLYEEQGHRITRDLTGNEPLAQFPDYVTFAVQQVPPTSVSSNGVADAQPTPPLLPTWVRVVHMHRSYSFMHGTPFTFPLLPHEPFSETAKRMQAYLGYSDKEWSKLQVKVAMPEAARGEDLHDIEPERVLYDTFPKPVPDAAAPPPAPAAGSPFPSNWAESLAAVGNLMLVLDHPQRRQSKLSSSFERAVRIRN